MNCSLKIADPFQGLDADDLILLAEGRKVIMETYHLTTEKAYQAWMENSQQKRGRWLKKVLLAAKLKE